MHWSSGRSRNNSLIQGSSVKSRMRTRRVRSVMATSVLATSVMATSRYGYFLLWQLPVMATARYSYFRCGYFRYGYFRYGLLWLLPAMTSIAAIVMTTPVTANPVMATSCYGLLPIMLLCFFQCFYSGYVSSLTVRPSLKCRIEYELYSFQLRLSPWGLTGTDDVGCTCKLFRSSK